MSKDANASVHELNVPGPLRSHKYTVTITDNAGISTVLDFMRVEGLTAGVCTLDLKRPVVPGKTEMYQIFCYRNINKIEISIAERVNVLMMVTGIKGYYLSPLDAGSNVLLCEHLVFDGVMTMEFS